MAWKIGMAVLEGVEPARVIDALGLQPSADIRPQLPLGDAIDHRDTHWGVGALGAFTVVTGPVRDDSNWKRLSTSGRVLVFDIDEAGNSLYIYADGERVVRREEKRGSRPWTPSHPLENRIRTKQKPDYIAGVFRNLTGTQLVDSMNTVVAMHVLPPTTAPELGPIADKLDATLAEPDPTPGWLEDLAWLNRWIALHDCLNAGWDVAPRVVVEEWIPRVVEHIATWPDMRRSLSYESFERISKGHDDGRFGDFAPLYRSLTISRGAGRPLDWKPKLFATFFAHPVCRALAVLDVSCNYYLPVAFAELLARSPLLENLHTISFDRVHFGNEGVLAFARAAHWTNLRELDLRGTDIDASVLPVLAGSVFARDLRSLALAGDVFGPIARELHAFPALRRLGLSRGTTFDAAAVRAMLESDVLPDLEQLALSYWEDSDLEPLRAIRPGLAITA